MPKTREQIDAQLADLERQMPALIEQYPPDGDRFFEAFGTITETITESAAGDDAECVRGKINCILAEFGLVPGETEGESCTGSAP